MSYNGKTAGLTLDWNHGFSLHETDVKTPLWQFKFSQLRGSSDDGKSKLKLHFQDIDTRAIETKVLIYFYFKVMFIIFFIILGVGMYDPPESALLHARFPHSQGRIGGSRLSVHNAQLSEKYAPRGPYLKVTCTTLVSDITTLWSLSRSMWHASTLQYICQMRFRHLRFYYN